MEATGHLRGLKPGRQGPVTVLIMARAPGPQAKTRLSGALTGEEREALVEAMLLDTLELVSQQSQGRTVLALAGDAGPTLRQTLAAWPGLTVVAQGDGTLGERLDAAVRALWDAGPVCVLGSDSPHLPVAALARLIEGTAAGALVLGPAEDGGYWGLGIGRLDESIAEALFREIPWSTPEVLAVTRERLQARGQEVLLVDPWFDLDEPAALERLMRAPALPDGGSSAPRTRAQLKRFLGA